MARFDSETIARQLKSPRWSALARTGLSLDAVGRFDPALVRDTRVLVPIDVQALVVPAGSAEPMVRLPLSIAAPDDAPPAPATDVLADGPPRPAGVHLHWAMPDALLRGKLADNGPTNRLALPALPDRWVVLRVVAPKGASAPVVRGWVIEADTTRVVALDQWPAGAAAAAATGRTVPPDGLTGSCGGSLNWTGTYDATLNRFALHDPLDDLGPGRPQRREGDQLAYLVAGWWSDPGRDPLDGAQTASSLHERLRQLGWALVEDREDDEKQQRERRVVQDKQASIGLMAATRRCADVYGQRGSAFGEERGIADRQARPAVRDRGVRRQGERGGADRAALAAQRHPSRQPVRRAGRRRRRREPAARRRRPARLGRARRRRRRDARLDRARAWRRGGAPRLRAAARCLHRQPRRPHRQRRRPRRRRGVGARSRLREPAGRRRRHRPLARRRRRRPARGRPAGARRGRARRGGREEQGRRGNQGLLRQAQEGPARRLQGRAARRDDVVGRDRKRARRQARLARARRPRRAECARGAPGGAALLHAARAAGRRARRAPEPAPRRRRPCLRRRQAALPLSGAGDPRHRSGDRRRRDPAVARHRGASLE